MLSVPQATFGFTCLWRIMLLTCWLCLVSNYAESESFFSAGICIKRSVNDKKGNLYLPVEKNFPMNGIEANNKSHCTATLILNLGTN